MLDMTIIVIDLAKRVFQLHNVASDGSDVFCKKLSRAWFWHRSFCILDALSPWRLAPRHMSWVASSKSWDETYS